MALPLDTLVPGGLRSGSVFCGNFFRQAVSGEMYRETLRWSPTYQVTAHVPERFGELKLQ